MESHRKAKILATLGPSSSSIEMISKLINAGMNTCRVNMSHGTHEGHAQLISNIREASKIVGKEVGILIDLQGPKIRVDKLVSPLELQVGQEWVIGPSSVKDEYPEYKDWFIPTIYEDLVNDSDVGQRILFDDGLIVAQSTALDRKVLKIKIKVGGILKSNKGINLPDAIVSAPSFTEKDHEDLMFGLKHNIDFVALSFVRKKEDVLKVKYLLHKFKLSIPIVAKLENPEAIKNMEEIVKSTDIVMVARGDMGVELGNHLVPSVQKRLINLCNKMGRPVITATQMLESMIQNSTPTRAEASDVANAIWDGTDVVMLSAETASGKYPLETVEMMNQIIIEAEKTPKERGFLRNLEISSVTDSVMIAASVISEKIKAKNILAVSESGRSCLHVSKYRPSVPVIGITNSLETLRRMTLYWGITPFFIEYKDEHDDDFEYEVISRIKRVYKLVNGDKLVITRGDGRFFSRGMSNSVRIEILKDSPAVLGGGDGLIETKCKNGKILLDTSMCASCQSCVAICPHKIFAITDDEDQKTYVDSKRVDECTMDMECVRVCPTGAIEIIP